MKKFWNSITKREIFFAVSGLIIGLFASLYIFAYLVPSGEDMILLYESEKSRIESGKQKVESSRQ